MDILLLIIICIDFILNIAILTSTVSRFITLRKLSRRLDAAIRASYFNQIKIIKGDSDEVPDDR